MKETYSVRTPRKIIWGDPWYFDTIKGKELERLVVKLKPPAHFETRVVLEESPNEKYPSCMNRSMVIYLAPKANIDTYMKDMMYKGQCVDEKDIGVDTAKYYLEVDDKDDEIYTAADGLWGNQYTYYRLFDGKKYVDAVVIVIFLPEPELSEDIHHYLNYFFQDIKQIENVEKPEEEIMEGEDQKM